MGLLRFPIQARRIARNGINPDLAQRSCPDFIRISPGEGSLYLILQAFSGKVAILCDLLLDVRMSRIVVVKTITGGRRGAGGDPYDGLYYKMKEGSSGLDLAG